MNGKKGNPGSSSSSAKVVYRDIEEQKVEELSDTIKELKMLSNEISAHLDSENNDLLGKMTNNYDIGQKALKGVMNKIDEVLTSGSASRTTCYLIGIIVIFFVIMYLLK